MGQTNATGRRMGGLALALAACATFAAAEPKHGIAMYGEPALPPDFVSLPYANPDAPKGGRIVQGEGGTFDSLNPHVRKGSVPWQLRFLAYESLMGRSYDEPFTLYGLLAESIETPDDRSWVEFTLREEARFSDGTPVKVEDVIWSYETLGTIGHPRYAGFWGKVATMEQTGNRSVKITFNTEDRELALIAGMRPILKKAQWDGIDMREAPIDMIPISTAPYVIDDYEAGRFVSLKRDEDYWGNDLNFRRGTNNLDEIRMEFYADGSIMVEAFKAGELSTHREFNAQKWDELVFPAVERGDVVKSIIPHQRPTGITGFVMNTRNPLFADIRVRDAMLHAFNFEFINEVMTGSKQPRITSYFSNSVLGMREGPAEGRVAEMLAPFADDLPPEVLAGYALPQGDGSERNRANIAAAADLLTEAGWTVDDQGVRRNADGEPFAFTFLLKVGDNESEQMIDLYRNALSRLGVQVDVEKVDSAQYKERTNVYDFDMTYYRRGLSLSPGNEQMLYWGANGVTEPGTRNWMGMDVPAAEAMIDAMVNSGSREDFLAATRALDRILTTGRYVIPIYQFNISRIAHAKELKYPADNLPMYGDWIGFKPDVWWYEEE
ncbi:MAG: extracellular solute-binding protein [Shimia sp.]